MRERRSRLITIDKAGTIRSSVDADSDVRRKVYIAVRA